MAAAAGTRANSEGATAGRAAQVAQYQHLLHQVLDRDLKQVVEARDKQQSELQELEELLQSLERLVQVRRAVV